MADNANTLPMRDAHGLLHYAGCEWICGIHDPREYFCACITPKPARGNRKHCSDCDARIPDEEDQL